MTQQYIVFYDDVCGLCNFAVQLLLKLDTRGRLFFAPLSGATAQAELTAWRKTIPPIDSIVFLEKVGDTRHCSYWSRAIFRCLFAIGGGWKILGMLGTLPSIFLYPYDCIYRFIAKRRRNFCPYVANKEAYRERFLP